MSGELREESNTSCYVELTCTHFSKEKVVYLAKVTKHILSRTQITASEKQSATSVEDVTSFVFRLLPLLDGLEDPCYDSELEFSWCNLSNLFSVEVKETDFEDVKDLAHRAHVLTSVPNTQVVVCIEEEDKKDFDMAKRLKLNLRNSFLPTCFPFYASFHPLCFDAFSKFKKYGLVFLEHEKEEENNTKDTKDTKDNDRFGLLTLDTTSSRKYTYPFSSILRKCEKCAFIAFPLLATRKEDVKNEISTIVKSFIEAQYTEEEKFIFHKDKGIRYRLFPFCIPEPLLDELSTNELKIPVHVIESFQSLF